MLSSCGLPHPRPPAYKNFAPSYATEIRSNLEVNPIIFKNIKEYILTV